MLSVEKYGLKIGRLWLRWPYVDFRDWWVGVYFKTPYWEGGIYQRVVYVVPFPCLVFLFQWSSR